MSEKKTFFISRAGADKRWAELIASVVRDAGHEAIYQDEHFRVGQSFVDHMTRAAEAGCTIAVLSRAYFESEYCLSELNAALAADPLGRRGRIIPVRVEDVEIPKLLGQLAYLDVVGVEEEIARQRLMKTLAGHGAAELPTPLEQPRAGEKPCNLPLASIGKLFKGREQFLENLRERLGATDRRAAAIVNRLAVHGLGGVGKTRAAVEYALRHVEEYTALLFVSATTPAELRANLANLVGVLGIEAAAVAIDRQVAAVLDWLNVHPGWLLIIDNVDTEEAAEEIHRLLVRLRAGQVLITSRIANWSAAVEPLELDVLEPGDASEFLLERTQHRRKSADDAMKAASIVRELDGLALAMEQAGAYIDRLRLSFADYQKRWEEKRAEVLNWHDVRLMQYPASVAVTWETTVAQLSGAERQLLQVLAWLAPEPIPRFLLEAAPLAQAIPEADVALAGLAAYSLARFNATGDAIIVHRLLREITRNRIPLVERTNTLRIALEAVDGAAVGVPSDVRSWSVWTPLAAHADTVIRSADTAGLAEPAARLMSQLGRYRRLRGQFRAAEPLFRRALAIGEASFGHDHTDVAIRLNNLARLLQDTNRLAEAEPLYRRALAIDEASFGPDHPNVARGLNNLAGLLRDTNRLAEAEPLYRRALAIGEASLGPDHPNVASGLNNLALLLRDTNRLAEAEPLYRRALAMGEASLGPDHPKVASGLNNLALLLQVTNRLAEAEPLYRRALAIDEASFGRDHPNVAIRLNNLAGLLRATNRLAEAEPLYGRALAIDEASVGPDHPNVARGLNNLALLLQDTNRLAEAEPLYRRALGIDETSFGPDHPDVAIDLNNLALLLRATNRLAEAEPLYRRAVKILINFRLLTGHEHPELRACRANYVKLLAALGNAPDQIERELIDLGCPPP